MSEQKESPAFGITEGKGFYITFKNGYTVSVQFGGGNYCDNYRNETSTEANIESGKLGSNTAECAVWADDGLFLRYGDWGNLVSNRSTPADVLELLIWAAAQEKKP